MANLEHKLIIPDDIEEKISLTDIDDVTITSGAQYNLLQLNGEGEWINISDISLGTGDITTTGTITANSSYKVVLGSSPWAVDVHYNSANNVVKGIRVADSDTSGSAYLGDWKSADGSYSVGGVWLGVATPDRYNYVIQGSGSATAFNAVSDAMYFRITGSNKWKIDSSGSLLSGTDGTSAHDIITAGDITIDSDTNGLILGADQDMLISSDAPGDINFTSAANTDITATFIGTTNSGQFMWMEDEDYFHFLDAVNIGDGTNQAQFAADGELTLAGTARVTKSIWIPFDGLKAPGTKPATYVDHGISGAWEFSDATDDTIVANIKFPEDMDMSVAPTICIGWSTNTAVTSETAVWQLEYLYTQIGEDTTAAAQATITVNSNAVAQADGLIVAYFPAMDIPNASDVCVHIRIKRLGADGDDDLTDTAELHGIAMTYTMNKLGTAT